MLNEILDLDDNSGSGGEPINITWEPPLDKRGENNYRATFDVEGDPYYVGFSKQPKKKLVDYYMVWDLNRSRMSWWWVIKSLFNGQHKQFTRTNMQKNTGYTLRVMKSVFQCIHDFVDKQRPTIIEYDEADADLKRFYNKIAMRLAPKFGYDAHDNMLVKQGESGKPNVRSVISPKLVPMKNIHQ